MLKKQLTDIPKFINKIAVINIFLVANAIVWYASILRVLQSSVGRVGEESWLEPNSQIFIWSVHFAGLIISALVGAKIAGRTNRNRFIILWMTSNVALSLTIVGLDYTNFTLTAILAIFYSVSFGLGMPMCMSHYSDSVPVENRGRTSGITMLIGGIGIFAFATAPMNFLEIGIVLSIWRFSSLAFFLVATKSSLKVETKKGTISFKNVLSQRSFLTYYIPWVLFSFVNFLVPLQLTGAGEQSNTILLIQTAFLGIFAILGGFLLDSIGRKKIAIMGFIMLGLSAAVRGIDSTSVSSMFFSAIFEGTAWGLLLVLFILTLWGDLSDTRPSDKYYAIGVSPFFVSMLIGFTIRKQIEDVLPGTALFPFAAFFLFIAVLPLFYAPETLPDKIMKGRELKNYIEKAQIIVKKETEKTQNEEPEREHEEPEETTDGKGEKHDEYDEARRLAEKYY